MSIVAGLMKGLGAAGLIVGPVFLIGGIFVGLQGLNEAQDCEDSGAFDPCRDDGEVFEAKMYGGAAAAGGGIVLVLLGSIFFFVGRGVEQRAERKAEDARSPLPSIDRDED